MIRSVGTILFGFLAIMGVIYALEWTQASGLYESAGPAAAGASLSPFPDLIPTATRIVGTLTYYPNNAGIQVPYLVFTDEGGNIRTKALVFESWSTCETSSGNFPCSLIDNALATYYGGNPVVAEGTIETERLAVSSLSTVR